MVAHQSVGVDPQAMRRGAFSQQTEIVAAIAVIQKDGATTDPALGDVEGYPGYFQTSLAWQERSWWPTYVKCPGLGLQAASAQRDGSGRREPYFGVA